MHGVIYRKAPVARLRISFAVRCFGYIRSGQINLDFVIHVAENQKAINNVMQALMLGKIADTILSQIEKLESENKELQDTIANEKAMQINYSYADIRKWLSHFRTLDYSKTKNRKDLIDTFIYRVILYDDKMKVLFHIKGGQQGELLLNLIFPDYPDGHGDDGENAQKIPENEKETDKAVSNSDINAECAYTSRLVEIRGFEPLTYTLRTYRATNCAISPKL